MTMTAHSDLPPPEIVVTGKPSSESDGTQQQRASTDKNIDKQTPPTSDDEADLEDATSNDDNSSAGGSTTDNAAVVTKVEVKTSTTTTTTKKTSFCEQYYGPYPRAVPIPQISSDVEVPEAKVADSTLVSYHDVAEIDFRDMKSPDEWLPRDGRLVRLTGKHPFNVEPPLSILNQYKFITPSSLHYVRNHGLCPKLSWDTHTVTVSNAVTNVSATLSMDAIVNMKPVRELPVTLVCAGNRRKEQNNIRQTIGFNWGSSGVGTNVYRGILIRDVFKQCGLLDNFMVEDSPEGDDDDSADRFNIEDYHVELIGVEDLPNKIGPGPFVEQGEEWGKTVKYGTSIPLARVMNPAYDIMLSYEANGELLQPDHGYPIRIIIPGYIGGRMIKWLAAINIIKHETYSHYHYHDNRILPPAVTTYEQSIKEDYWYKPEYIFSELNINSVIAKPNHNDVVPIPTGDVSQKTYEMAGYAYTGGGRKITRMEVSNDNGVTWKLATLDRKEKPTKYGMYWCWIWWTYNISILDLLTSDELLCRAWDESNNTQSLVPTWNMMGMGNNHIFRVKIHMTDDRKSMWFEHPTQPGQLPGGYMTRIADKPYSAGFGRILDQPELTASASTVTVAPTTTVSTDKKLYTMDEIKKHSTIEEGVWIIVNDKVYDCTEYLELHPGGIESITMNGGLDATEDFVAIHSTKATKMLEKYYIGDVDKSSTVVSTSTTEDVVAVDSNGRPLALNPKKKIALTLQEKVVLSRDSFMLNFALPSKEHVLGLPTGKHMFISAKINDEVVVRRYTPISSNYDIGCVKLVIKAYYPCERFPAGGKMSQHLDSLKVGDTLDFKGPVGEFVYDKNGVFQVEHEKEKRTVKAFNMIAGGTGITPCMQIAAEILRNAECTNDGTDTTLVSLIFACRIEEDLLLRDVLDEWSVKYAKQFKVHYILSDEWSKDWKYSTGFVSTKLFQEHLYPSHTTDTYNLMCGPPIMIDKGCRPALRELGHATDTLFSF